MSYSPRSKLENPDIVYEGLRAREQQLDLLNEGLENDRMREKTRQQQQ